MCFYCFNECSLNFVEASLHLKPCSFHCLKILCSGLMIPQGFPKDATFIHLLRHLRSITSPGERLFPYSLEVYRRELKEIQMGFGLETGWTPHSPRAGYASEASALGGRSAPSGPGLGRLGA